MPTLLAKDTTVATEALSAASNQAMETLTAQWYNAVVTGLGLSPSNFNFSRGQVQHPPRPS
jgi:hypothetical protein